MLMSNYLLHVYCFFFFFKQKTAYEMRISDWSSDVCSSDLKDEEDPGDQIGQSHPGIDRCDVVHVKFFPCRARRGGSSKPCCQRLNALSSCTSRACAR